MSMGMDSRAIEDMMRMLANGPEQMRRAAMKARIDELLNMQEQQRQQNIQMMISAMHRLSYPETRNLIKTRTEIIAGYPEHWRRTVMMSRMQALMSDPSLNQRDMQVMQEVLMELPEYLRMPFMNTMQQLMQSMGQPGMMGQQGYAPQYGQQPQTSPYSPQYQYPQAPQQQYVQPQYQQQYPAQQQSTESQGGHAHCPHCGHELQWVPQYQKYYCHNEQRYI